MLQMKQRLDKNSKLFRSTQLLWDLCLNSGSGFSVTLFYPNGFVPIPLIGNEHPVLAPGSVLGTRDGANKAKK